MVPPPGEWRVAVDRVRSVPGDVFLRNGHMALDWCRRASIMRSRSSIEVGVDRVKMGKEEEKARRRW
jgi:hypothetical protein